LGLEEVPAKPTPEEGKGFRGLWGWLNLPNIDKFGKAKHINANKLEV